MKEDSERKNWQSIWKRFSGTNKYAIGTAEVFLEKLTSPIEHETGFIGRPEPDMSHGLLFSYPEDRTLGFWMKDVPYDLELLAFDPGTQELFQIIHLDSMDTTTKVISRPCRSVVEVCSGWCKKNNIKIGDKLSSF